MPAKTNAPPAIMKSDGTSGRREKARRRATIESPFVIPSNESFLYLFSSQCNRGPSTSLEFE
ncbi:MAG: hypothetical protein ACE5QW_03850 [Thermoplasmata archaeon]